MSGLREGAVHRVILPAARGRQSGLKQVEMVVKHYHFYQQVVSGGSVIPPNILGTQDMSVPPPVTVLSKPVVQSHPRVVPSHPKTSTPKTGHTNANKPGPQQKTVVRVRSGKPVLTLWGSSHLAENHLLGPDLKRKLEAHFQHVINLSEGGAKLTNEFTEKIEIEMKSHQGPNQVYVLEFGSNNMRKTTKPALEVAKVVSRFRRIMTEAQKAKVRVLLCGTIPDPRPAVDSKLKLLDEALEDLDMGEGNRFLALRGSMLDAGGKIRTDIFKPRGDIHLNASGTQIVSLRIQRMLEVMLPNLVPVRAPVHTPPASVQAPAPVQAPAKTQRVRILAPVQDLVPAPVVVNAPPAVDATLVAAVINAPVVVQHVAVADQGQVETPMEVDEDEILARLFFKRYGRALPEKEKEKENDVDQIKFVIDLTDEKEDEEMEVATPAVVVKTEPIEVANVTNVTNVTNVAKLRQERRELVKARKAITAFGKSLRKTNVIPEKEMPIVADSNVSEDTIESVNTIETAKQVIAESDRRAEQVIADSDAAIKASQEFVAEFGDTPLDEFDSTGSGFQLYGPEDVLPSDDEDTMIDNV
jgi:lysophospholipase L1-like esterase